MPGCPMRDVVSTVMVPGGSFLKLSCGHELWVAGDKGCSMDRAQCQQGPCYSFQRGMGDQC